MSFHAMPCFYKSVSFAPCRFLLLLLLLSTNCQSGQQIEPNVDSSINADSNTTCTPTDPRTFPIQLAVFPEDGEQPYVDVVSTATKSIRVFIYIMGYGGILDGLKQKAAAGVDVRVILDQGQTSNDKYYEELSHAGVSVLWSDPKYTHMHAKVIIADDKEAIVSTGNFSLKYAIEKNRDLAARTTDPRDIADLIELFDVDWERGAPKLECTRLIVSPINAHQRLLDLINAAESSLLIESMQFAETNIRDAVSNRKNAGVDVRVLLADPDWVDANNSAASFLKSHAIPVRYMNTPAVHIKSLVVDGKTAYAGSINFSYTSISKNREVGLFFSDTSAVDRVASTFEKDWGIATEF
ncbi:MAG: phospholipase D-like domain-containing protein [Pseudomonadota bacterium]